jgi:hypothetical protein
MALDGDSKQECSRSGFDRYSQANQCSVLYYIGEDIRYTSRWRAKCKLWRQDAAPRRLMNVLVARIKKKIGSRLLLVKRAYIILCTKIQIQAGGRNTAQSTQLTAPHITLHITHALPHLGRSSMRRAAAQYVSGRDGRSLSDI